MLKSGASKRGAKDTASRARQASRKAKQDLQAPDGTIDNRPAAEIAATAGSKPRDKNPQIMGARQWRAQPGAKILVTDDKGQVHEATIISELRHAVVAELRDDMGTRVMAAFSERGGASTWRSDDSTVDAPLAAGPTPAPTVANTRIGRERDRNRLSQADWVQRQQMALAKLAPKDEPAYSDSPLDQPELKDFPLDKPGTDTVQATGASDAADRAALHDDAVAAQTTKTKTRTKAQTKADAKAAAKVEAQAAKDDAAAEKADANA